MTTNKMAEDAITSLLNMAESLGGDLDDVVYYLVQELNVGGLNEEENEDDQERYIEENEEQAAAINNGGLESQVRFLLAHYEYEVVERIIHEVG